MTVVMVLGVLLTFGAMSGYEIQQKMQSAQTDIWAFVQPASIYHALRKLEKDGYVALQTLEQTGNRTKAIYEVTEKGRMEFSRLLVEAFQKSPVVFPAPLYTLLTFVDQVPGPKLEQALNDQMKEIRAIHDLMVEGQKAKKEYLQEIPRSVELIFQNIYDQCELQLKFLEQLKRELFEQRTQPANPEGS